MLTAPHRFYCLTRPLREKPISGDPHPKGPLSQNFENACKTRPSCREERAKAFYRWFAIMMQREIGRRHLYLVAFFPLHK
jgi:hypothetical protein